jgi:hypothetical protein
MRGDPRLGRTRLLFASSGVLLGAAMLFTQKVLFTLPAAMLVMLGYLLQRHETASPRAKLAGALSFLCGVLTPIVLTLALFAGGGALAAFLEHNLLLNLDWKFRASTLPVARSIVQGNPTLTALALVGLLVTCVRAGGSGGLRHGDALIALHTLGLLAGAFLISVGYAQYFLMLLPLAALLAGDLLVRTVDAVASAAAGAWRHAPALADGVLGLSMVALSVHPLGVMNGILHQGPSKVSAQLARLRLVMANTMPEDTVMDGFTGAGAFRPHAYGYFFLHEEIRALIGAEERHRLVAGLRDGEIAPKVVILDRDLRQLSPEAVAFFEENYDRTEDGLVWTRKPLWLDDQRFGGRLEVGDGPTDVLVGRGWYPPEWEGGRSLRRTRGRRSTLRLPLQMGGAGRLAVHARLESAPAPARLELLVNDLSCGDTALEAGWRDYVFRVPAGALRDGVNRVRLSYSSSPGDPDGAPAGGSSVMAVDYLHVGREGAAP